MMNWLIIVSKLKEIPLASWANLTTTSIALLSGILLYKTFTNKELRRLKRKAFWYKLKSKFKRHGSDGLGCLVTIILILLVSAIVGYGIYYLVTVLF
jgi:hypothetical protein